MPLRSVNLMVERQHVRLRCPYADNPLSRFKKNEKRLAPQCPNMLFIANCCPSVLATSHIWYDRSHLWPVWVCACTHCSACVRAFMSVSLCLSRQMSPRHFVFPHSVLSWTQRAVKIMGLTGSQCLLRNTSCSSLHWVMDTWMVCLLPGLTTGQEGIWGFTWHTVVTPLESLISFWMLRRLHGVHRISLVSDLSSRRRNKSGYYFWLYKSIDL